MLKKLLVLANLLYKYGQNLIANEIDNIIKDASRQFTDKLLHDMLDIRVNMGDNFYHWRDDKKSTCGKKHVDFARKVENITCPVCLEMKHTEWNITD